MNIKKLSEEGESQYCNCPPSGRGNDSINIELKTILPNIKSISLRKPFAMIVGSMATQGKSNNDVDLVIRGEDFSNKVKEAINFRLYRLFSEILNCAYDDTPKYVHIHYNNAGSYTSYIPLYELNLVPVNKFDTIQMSRIPFKLRGTIELVNKSEGARIIAGYASVAVVDQEEQFIPIETLQKGIKSLLDDPSYSNLMLIHQNIQVGKILKSYGEYETKIDEKGLFIVAEIRKDIKTADEVWKAIMDKTLNGFSIGCEVLLSHKECDDKKCVTILDEINIFEVSVCSSPVNQDSGFIVISKSKFNDMYVCDECSDMDINMSKKIKKFDEELEDNLQKEEIKTTEVPAEKPAEPVLSKEEPPIESNDPIIAKLAELERKIAALEGILQELAKKPPEEEAPVPPETPAPTEAPKPPEYPLPNQKSGEEEMALFMLDYIINNPKASAQEISKAWIESKKQKLPPPKEEPVSEPPKPEEPSKYPYPDQKSFDNLKLSVDKILEKLSEKEKEDELKVALKARDDQIEALKKEITIVQKMKDDSKPKTIQKSSEEVLEVDNPIRVERGTVYLKK